MKSLQKRCFWCLALIAKSIARLWPAGSARVLQGCPATQLWLLRRLYANTKLELEAVAVLHGYWSHQDVIGKSPGLRLSQSIFQRFHKNDCVLRPH